MDGTVMPPVVVRPRRADDIPALGDVLLAQQPSSRYPFRDPLPVPVEQFLHADDAVVAWTAEIAGQPVGHVCRVGPAGGFPGEEEMNRACADAHGCTVDELSWVSTLFVGLGARGLGVGRRLLQVVMDDIRAADLRPCLEVLEVHPAAKSLYEATGWREVMRLRPAWLREAAGEDRPNVLVMAMVSPTDSGEAEL